MTAMGDSQSVTVMEVTLVRLKTNINFYRESPAKAGLSYFSVVRRFSMNDSEPFPGYNLSLL